MSGKPFHHGDLREELLRLARSTLRTTGEDALSLRQLARDAGVSHGAPRRHFPERRHLLDALSVRGFDELTAAVETGGHEHRDDHAATFATIARIYIDFAVHESALMDLMFATKGADAAPEVNAAAQRFFDAVGSIMRAVIPPSATLVDDELRVRLLLVSTLHGIASLVAAGRLDPATIDELIGDAGRLFGVGSDSSASSSRR